VLRTLLIGMAGFGLGLGGATGAVVALRPAAAEEPALAEHELHPSGEEAAEAGTPATPAGQLPPAHVDGPGMPDQAAAHSAVSTAGSTARSTSELAAAAEPQPRPAAGEAHPATPPVTGNEPVAESGTGDESLAEPSAADTAAEGGSARLASIFRAMKPADAARVLERLENSEIQSILLQMSDRQAANIVSHFQPARAAELSRVLIRGGGAR
jgi:hypothetical protein